MQLKGSILSVSSQRLRLYVVAAAIALVYVPSRLFVLQQVIPAGNDTELYARFAYVHRLAAERHVPFHDAYRQMGLAAFDKHYGVPPSFTSAPLTVVGYPPLAVAVITVPGLIVRQGRPISRMSLPEFTVRYQKVYRWFCASVEMIAAVIVSLLLFGLYRNERPVATAFRMCVLCCAGLCMPRILYDRLDIIMGALTILSLAALVQRLRLPSFFFFALAANFKLIPLVLMPILVLGSFEAWEFQQPTMPERLYTLLGKSAVRGLILCGMTAGVFLLFFLTEGRGVFDFFTDQLDRGIHIESTWGTVALGAARIAGTPFQVVHEHGGFNVSSTAANFLSQLSPVVLAVAVLALTFLFIIRCIRRPGRREDGALSLLDPPSAIEASLLFLCVVFSFSKVFSPQFLLALVPLVALLPFSGKGAFVFVCIFIGTCLLSTIIYPRLYRTVIFGPAEFGCFLLAARTLLLLGMTGILLFRLFGTRSSDQNRPHPCRVSCK
jgi:hypothetical protein